MFIVAGCLDQQWLCFFIANNTRTDDWGRGEGGWGPRENPKSI